MTEAEIPGVSQAYWVVDADAVFFRPYSPLAFPQASPPGGSASPGSAAGSAYFYVAGEDRDCGNPPYFATLDALGLPKDWVQVGRARGRLEKWWWAQTRCSSQRHGSIERHGASFSQKFSKPGTAVLRVLPSPTLCYSLPLQASVKCHGKKSTRVCKAGRLCPIAHQMVFDRSVLASLHADIVALSQAPPPPLQQPQPSTFQGAASASSTDLSMGPPGQSSSGGPRATAAAAEAAVAVARAGEAGGSSRENRREDAWWEVVLLKMPAWHTSPFSECVRPKTLRATFALTLLMTARAQSAQVPQD